MPGPMLVDTDVIIDYLRGQVDALAFLENLTEPLLISVITVAELYAGVREGPEREALDTLISVFERVDVDPEIAVASGLFRREFGKTHNVGLADALIAATAQSRHATLVTLNRKHFSMLADINVPYQKKG
jgi:predicted nucleic acid-binding protein